MEDNYKKKLSPERYRILRESDTEPPFSGEYVNHNEIGEYTCGACGSVLFTSKYKFDSDCGWPSFYDVSNTSAIKLVEDRSHGMRRLEVKCTSCDRAISGMFLKMRQISPLALDIA